MSDNVENEARPASFTRDGINLNHFFCNSRLRADTWNSLKDAILQLCNNESRRHGDEALFAQVVTLLSRLTELERYWAFPGQNTLDALRSAYRKKQWDHLARLVTIIARLISTDQYRSYDWLSVWQRVVSLENGGKPDIGPTEEPPLSINAKPYFEVLVVDSLAIETEEQIRDHHVKHKRPEDQFNYSIVVAPSLEDAVVAALLNYNIQSCILRYTFPVESSSSLNIVDYYIRTAGFSREQLYSMTGMERTGALARILRTIRPELDLYLLSEATVEHVAQELHREFRRCFFGSEDYPEMRLTILKGIQQRYTSPFFNALKTYAQQPTGVFHAMPISRSKSISKSHWIRDYGEFYGDRIFLSETSSTSGGLDSLLQPSGSIRRAQELAAQAFGSEQTLFVSNGTSTANKIVLQGITRPGDIVLMPSNCHKSHHYSAILSDVDISIIDPYPIQKYSIQGAVSIRAIKERLVELKAENRLDRVRALILTNLTFDGISYNLARLMTECLALKPDLIFFVDEAWFAYGMFMPITRTRSAMHVAGLLKARFASREYRNTYMSWRESLGGLEPNDSDACLGINILPDPDLVKVRVYATQSTHKTLTALRQASMIHIHDEDFLRDVNSSLHEAYLCHTSTSPNYQILASLDIARRQMHFEGYELIQKAYELALIFRSCMSANDLLSRFYRVLRPSDIIPPEFRPTGHEGFFDEASGWQVLEEAWRHDEFALDPTRITIDITETGLEGRDLQDILMNRFDIQVNKTSINTVLFIIHIGSTRGMITYLLESLADIARELSSEVCRLDSVRSTLRSERIDRRLKQPPALPGFTSFHQRFSAGSGSSPADGNIRSAYYLSREQDSTEYIWPNEATAKSIENGTEYVSAGMVVPYPPGHPVLIPGQLISPEIIRFLASIRLREIHGYDDTTGLLVFNPHALKSS